MRYAASRIRGLTLAPLALAVAALTLCACHGRGASESAETAVSNPSRAALPRAAGVVSTTVDEEGHGEEAEDAEEAEEAEMRRKGLAALAAYRAPSCAAAIARIEGLLVQGKGRWEERVDDALPGDLAAILTQAELWASESAATCRSDPAQPRFDALRTLMQALWRYPTLMSKAELEQHLHGLGD